MYAREAALAALDACPSPCFLLHLARDPSLKFRCLSASGRHSYSTVQVPALSPPSSSGAGAFPALKFRCRRFPSAHCQDTAHCIKIVSPAIF